MTGLQTVSGRLKQLSDAKLKRIVAWALRLKGGTVS